MDTGRTTILGLNLLTGLLLVGLLAGCGAHLSPAESAAASPTPTPSIQPPSVPAATQRTEEIISKPASPTAAPPTVTIEPTPTPLPPPTPTVEVNWLEVSGKTEDGLAYLGNPDAPVTVIDYADFM